MCALGTSGCLHKISSGMCLPKCERSKLAKVCFAAGALQPPGCWSFSRLFQEGGCTVRPSWAGACSRLLPLLCHDPAHAATALMMSETYSGPPKICPNLLADHLNSCRVVLGAPLHQMASSVSPNSGTFTAMNFRLGRRWGAPVASNWNRGDFQAQTHQELPIHPLNFFTRPEVGL